MSLRQRAYERPAVPFRFVDLPSEVRGADGGREPNPVLKTAIFVVHGIGLQRYPQTAVTLRCGFEDAIDQINREHPTVDVPPPFTYEGFWADYAVFETNFPREWQACSERERLFFSELWQRRSISALRTAVWFCRENLRLFHRRTIQDAGKLRGITLMAAAPLTVLAAAAMLVRHPRVLAEVLGDVRIYCDPRGDVETAIVQRVDYRVGAEFLKLLGLDWDFHDLPWHEQLEISGTRHVFTHVTWVAHSLGSVISFNVIGDILHRARSLQRRLADRAEARGPGAPVPEEDRQLSHNIARVETGLHRFVTLGSPLEQIRALFPDVLRRWPDGAQDRFGRRYAPGQRPTTRRSWWVNFYHVVDPISSRLVAPEFAPYVSNQHARLLRVPGAAHISYWHDSSILKYLVSRAYGSKLCPWPDPRFVSERVCNALRHVTAWLTLAGVVALLVVVGWWVASGRAWHTLWSTVTTWIRSLL
ncbi:MAG: hypothetical protein AUH07_05795 [Gemmatimonadetes bacterium 13_2_20CM_70_9]|nr:MAG: hypothetical protein AUH07_05795 [Gemmatimonadetes bacterium 13_2_20CM_70_9]PYP69666.1 MAG: hypothetical protein DMD41_16495 [Gemmatimonadota bacterium]